MMVRVSLRNATCFLGTLLAITLTGCAASGAQPPVPLTIYSSSAAYPWLSNAYGCVPPSAGIVLAERADAALELRLGEPEALVDPVFQVGMDDLLVIAHPQAGIGSLTPSQAEALFTGQFSNWSEVGGTDQAVQVWSFAPTVDIQEYFSRMVLHGRPVSSLARLAVSAQKMSDSVGAVPGSIGLLPRRWKAGNTDEVLMVASVPVLAIARTAPQGPLADLLSCMQAQQ